MERLPGAIAFCRFFSVLTKYAHEKANPMGAPDHAVSKCPDRRIFRAGSALAPTLFLLRPGRFLRGAVRRAANLINDCQWQSHLDSSALPTAPPLSRFLSPFLGGTRKGPPEGYPAESPNRASVRAPRQRHPAEGFDRASVRTTRFQIFHILFFLAFDFSPKIKIDYRGALDKSARADSERFCFQARD